MDEGSRAKGATFVLLANPMESAMLPGFVAAARAAHPDAYFLCAGDLLNVFPEPGEDHAGSMFFEVFGELLPRELERLRARGFARPEASALVGPLREFFVPGGRHHAASLEMARARYQRLFADLVPALGGRPFAFVPGNMDYPEVAAPLAALHPSLRMLDASRDRLPGLTVAGVGGIPRSAQPLAAVAAISPYELDDAAWQARILGMWGADVLVTHLSAREAPALADLAERSPARLVVSRAPFDLERRHGSCRGDSEVSRTPSGALVVNVRPFEPLGNEAFVVRLAAGHDAPPEVSTFAWSPPNATSGAAPRAASA